MYNRGEQPGGSRIYLFYFLFLLTFAFFITELFKKNILAYKYYQRLSEANRTQEEILPAPRGIFYDRYKEPLVINRKDKKYLLKRSYLYPELTAHLLGYMALPDEVNLKDYSCGAPPLSQQFVGKTGLEKYFECSLRGRYGKILYEVDAMGEKVRELVRGEAEQGRNVDLSISLALQRKAHEAFQGRPGGAIATDPKTGEVLLFYSSPSFDTNKLTEEQGLFTRLLNDDYKPLFDRLSLGLYPPGSVVKPVIALAALEEGVIRPQTTFEDTGIFKFGGVEFGNWYYLQYGKKEGEVDVVKAISRSNDIFFYNIGTRMPVSKFKYWFRYFGLDSTGLKPYLPQAQGILPDQEWKEENYGERWYTGDTVNLSIGQGFILLNPVQLHLATAALANRGRSCALSFEKGVLRHCTDLKLGGRNLDQVTSGMVRACAEGGTGWPFFDFKIRGKKEQVACKTGTAESQDTKAPPHAWFTVFAPVAQPEIVLTVFLENGGEGSGEAAPIAKEILTEYFSAD